MVKAMNVAPRMAMREKSVCEKGLDANFILFQSREEAAMVAGGRIYQ
jgi:hypothetical protein